VFKYGVSLMKAKSKAFCEKALSKRTKQKRCEYIGKGNCCKIDGDYCRGYNLYDKMHGVCTRKNCYEQGKSESLLLRDAEKKALAKKIQKKWKLAYCGNEMFYDFDEYMRQLVRDLGS